MQPTDATTTARPPESGDGQRAGDRAGRWVRPAEAARLLGVSERTVRRRVASGQYQVQRTGRNARIHLPAAALATASGEPSADSRDATVLALARAVEALQGALAGERSRSQRLEARLERLEDERARLLLRIGRLGVDLPPADEGEQPAAAPGGRPD